MIRKVGSKYILYSKTTHKRLGVFRSKKKGGKTMKKPKFDDNYNEFMNKIQKPKMKELWDNKEDEVWNRA